MPSLLFRKVDCVMLYVPNLDDALAFYRDRLGHPLVCQTSEAAGLKLPDSDAELVLQTGDRGLKVDFLVPSADEAAATLKKAGGTIVVPPFDIQTGRCVVVKDPWEHMLVLLDMSKGRLITDDEGNITGNARPE
jgi:lactoylglutathione lyase